MPVTATGRFFREQTGKRTAEMIFGKRWQKRCLAQRRPDPVFRTGATRWFYRMGKAIVYPLCSLDLLKDRDRLDGAYEHGGGR